MSPGPVTRPSLLEDVRDPRDSAAWTVFVRVYMPLVRRYCRGFGLDEGEAEEVTAAVFESIWLKVQTFRYDPEKGRFRSWLCRITKHALYDHVKGLRRRHARLEALRQFVEGRGAERLGDVVEHLNGGHERVRRAPAQPAAVGEEDEPADWVALFYAELFRAALELVVADGSLSERERRVLLLWWENRRRDGRSEGYIEQAMRESGLSYGAVTQLKHKASACVMQRMLFLADDVPLHLLE